MEPDVNVLLRARMGYLAAVSPSYDETLFIVAARVNASRSLGKADIGALLFWKRVRADTRWARALHGLPEEHVHAITAEAVAAVRQETGDLADAARLGRSALTQLPGFHKGDALASALLVAAAPTRMAVYDTRVQNGLEMLGLNLSSAPGRYARYMGLVGGLVEKLAAAGHDWTPREVDTALFWLGRPTAPR